ncbi:hypothetical protein GW17_00048287 [Ensete ventricosum]|nr:hypothetical protein GW17_00048287 [Ensete ventricosum]
MAKKAKKDVSSQGEGRGSILEKVKSKGKEPAKEATKLAKKPEGPHRLPTMKELCTMGGRVGDGKYFATRVSDLSGPQAGAPLKARWIDLLAPTRFWDDGLITSEYARGMLHPSIAKQLYSAPSEELVDQVMKSMVHDAGHVIKMLSERNFALRNEVLELKSGVSPDTVVAAEKRAINLEVDVKHLKAKVEHLKAALGDTE